MSTQCISAERPAPAAPRDHCGSGHPPRAAFIGRNREFNTNRYEKLNKKWIVPAGLTTLGG